MSLEHSTINWSAKQISTMIHNQKINLKHIVQRSDVWERARRSLFIDSIIQGYDIPKVYAKRFEDDEGNKSSRVYSMLDGKQRLTSIFLFLNDEFALSELKPVTYFDEVLNEEQTIDISGKLFSELPEGLQDLIKGVTITVVYYSNLTPEEEKELFRRLNNGKPLSTKSRTLASCQNLEELLEIGSHDIFSEMLTEKARDNKNQVTLVMKVWCMLNQSIFDVSFESRIFNPLLETVSVTEEQAFELATVLDYAMDVHKVLMDRGQKKLASKLYKETHFISLVPFFKLASDSEITEEFFADWLKEFFGTLDKTSISDAYNDAANSGVSKAINIQLRDTALSESYTKFFKTESDTPELPVTQEEPSEPSEDMEEAESETEEPICEEAPELVTEEEQDFETEQSEEFSDMDSEEESATDSAPDEDNETVEI